jgi:hypothetical protein
MNRSADATMKAIGVEGGKGPGRSPASGDHFPSEAGIW